jgi:hypothetical protein
MVSDLETTTDVLTGMKADPQHAKAAAYSIYAGAFLAGIVRRIFQDPLGPYADTGLKYIPPLAGSTVMSQLYTKRNEKAGFDGFMDGIFVNSILEAAGYFITDYLMR